MKLFLDHPVYLLYITFEAKNATAFMFPV